MALSRNRLRVVAALVSGLLLLTGAGEVLGACYCAHRGGSHEAPHMAEDRDEAETPGHADVHEEHGSANQTHGAEDETHGPAGGMCRALCALACNVNAPPVSDPTERVPDLRFVALVASMPPVESPDFVPANARPHVLPLSQAPPAHA